MKKYYLLVLNCICMLACTGAVYQKMEERASVMQEETIEKIGSHGIHHTVRPDFHGVGGGDTDSGFRSLTHNHRITV